MALLIKETMSIVANTVCRQHKDDIKAALSSVPLGPVTVTRRVESLSGDVDQQVLRDLALCEDFSVQLELNRWMLQTQPNSLCSSEWFSMILQLSHFSFHFFYT